MHDNQSPFLIFFAHDCIIVCKKSKILHCWIYLLTEGEETDEEWTPLQRFLVANNLTSIHPILESEQIDLEALMLLTETDIAALKLPLGPRRKLTNAIANRKKALSTPESVIKDSRL